MKKLLALILALAPSLALAQNAGWPPPGGAVAALGVYNTVAPTITNGQVNFLQTDANGNLNVNVKAGSGSGCAGTVGTPCIVAQATASSLNMTEANSAAILSAIQGSIPAGSALIGDVNLRQGGTALSATNGIFTNILQGNAVLSTANPLPIQSINPCENAAGKINVPISQTGNTKLISATSAKKNYVCSIIFNASDAENISIVEGTGSTCGTSTAAILGGTTAAAGMHFAANGGMARGNGNSWVMGATGTAVDLCLFQSGSGTIAGNLTYVQQ